MAPQRTNLLSDYLGVMKAQTGEIAPTQVPSQKQGAGSLSLGAALDLAAQAGDPSRFKGRESVPQEFRALADLESGGSALNRFLGGFKATDKGIAAGLVERFGESNVRVDPGKGIFLKEWNEVRPEELEDLKARGLKDEDIIEEPGQWPKVKRFTLQDPTPSTLKRAFKDLPGDIADLSADLMEMGLSAAAPAIGGAIGGAIAGPPGAVAGAGIGKVAGDPGANIARQVAGAALPGDEDISLKERAAILGLATVSGPVADAVVGKAIKAFDYARPGNLLRRKAKGELDIPGIEERIGLAEEVGIPIDFAQASRNPALTAFRGLLINSIGGGKISKGIESQLTGLSMKLDGLLNKAGRERSLETLGREISDVTSKHLDVLGDLRSSRLKEQFVLANKVSGGKRIVPLANTIREYLEQADRFGFSIDMGSASVAGGVAEKRFDQLVALADKRAKEAGKELSELSDDELLSFAQISPEEASRWLTVFGKASVGKGKVILGLEDPDLNMSIAASLLEAINKDLDQVALSGTVGKEAIGHIREGRKQWGVISETMNEIRESVLGQSLQMDKVDSPDAFVERLMGKWTPEESRKGLKILETLDKSAMQDVRRAAMEQVLEKTKSGGQISPAKLANLDPKKKAKLYAILSGDKTLLADWKKLVKFGDVISHGAGVGAKGSQTKPLQMADAVKQGLKSVVMNIASPLRLGATIAKAGLDVISTKFLADAMMDTNKRKALMTMIKTNAKTEGLLKAASRLGLIQVRSDVAQEAVGFAEGIVPEQGESPGIETLGDPSAFIGAPFGPAR